MLSTRGRDQVGCGKKPDRDASISPNTARGFSQNAQYIKAHVRPQKQTRNYSRLFVAWLSVEAFSEIFEWMNDAGRKKESDQDKLKTVDCELASCVSDASVVLRNEEQASTCSPGKTSECFCVCK